MTIEQSLLDQQVAIATLIGAGMPAIDLPIQETNRMNRVLSARLA